MGRNNVPHLGEWEDGRLYRFATVSPAGHRLDEPPMPDDGRMIMYMRETAPYTHHEVKGDEILATCWADGFQECMAAMWRDGHAKGRRQGIAEAQRDMRLKLGLKE